MKTTQIVQHFRDLVLIEEFIRRGARVPIVKGQFPHISDQPIRDLYRDINGRNSKRGLCPDSTISICRRHDQILNANTFYLIYKSLGGNEIFETTNPEILIAAYDQYVEMHSDDEDSLDFVGVYYVARDIKARILDVKFCKQCGVEYLYDTINEHWHMCPYCRTARRGKSRGVRGYKKVKKAKTLN